MKDRIQGGVAIGGGMLAFAAETVSNVMRAPHFVQWGLALSMFVLMIFGCGTYLRGKGYWPILGLTAILPPVGLALAMILPDMRPDKEAMARDAMQETARRKMKQTTVQQEASFESKQTQE